MSLIPSHAAQVAVLVSLTAIAAGCSSSAAVIVGEKKPPTGNWQSVKVYLHPPEQKYDEIAVLQASSANSWAAGDQGKLEKVIARLKERAWQVGANGVLLTSTGNQSGGSVNVANANVTTTGNYAYGTGMGTSIPINHKSGSAIAIYVYNDAVTNPRPASWQPAGGPGNCLWPYTSPSCDEGRSAGAPDAERNEAAVPAEPDDALSHSADVYDAIIKLDELRKRGLLTDEEFETEKRKLLSD